MKKLISIVLSILMLFSVTSGLIGSVQASEKTTKRGETDDFVYYYTEETGTASIFRYKGSATEVEIPGGINGYQITRIGSDSFHSNSKITSVTMPEGIESIGGRAFSGCQKLEYINIPESVTEIDFSAFDGCRSLADITIPKNVIRIAERAFADTAYYNDETNWENDVLYMGNFLIEARPTLAGDYQVKQGTVTIADFAFWECANLTSLTFADSIKRIGNSVVCHCSNLTNIEIPNSVKFIDQGAFKYATALETITIPASVEFIGQEAFSKCYSLKKIDVDAANDNYSSVNGVLFNKDCTTLIEYPCNLKGAYVIPDTVTTIAQSAADDCIDLTNVTIPNSVTTIEDSAFLNVGFSSITIPQTVVSIGKNAIGFSINPENDNPVSVENFIIYGYSESVAELYANYKNITFVSVGQATEPKESSEVDVSVPSYSTQETETTETSEEITQNTNETVETESTEVTEPTEATATETEATEPATTKKTLKATVAKKSIKAGATTKIRVTGKSGSVSYKSNNTKIAKVSKSGVVTGLKKGTAKIKVTSGKESVTITVKVSSSPKLSKKIISVKTNKSEKIKITGKASGTKVKISKCKIAKITVKGNKLIIKGTKKGKSKVTVTVNGVRTYLTVNVKK